MQLRNELYVKFAERYCCCFFVCVGFVVVAVTGIQRCKNCCIICWPLPEAKNCPRWMRCHSHQELNWIETNWIEYHSKCDSHPSTIHHTYTHTHAHTMLNSQTNRTNSTCLFTAFPVDIQQMPSSHSQSTAVKRFHLATSRHRHRHCHCHCQHHCLQALPYPLQRFHRHTNCIPLALPIKETGSAFAAAAGIAQKFFIDFCHLLFAARRCPRYQLPLWPQANPYTAPLCQKRKIWALIVSGSLSQVFNHLDAAPQRWAVANPIYLLLCCLHFTVASSQSPHPNTPFVHIYSLYLKLTAIAGQSIFKFISSVAVQ